MTPLTRPVRRKVEAPRRGLVVTLTPGQDALIEVREQRRRQGFTITVAGLYGLLAKRAADQAVAERARKRRKGGRGYEGQERD